ncbi:MAG: endonuclease/exonuclease/phosphatase family protein [Burkholderiales bacterium]|nr:endonuclease/exonuclease/phosphatase family protein [Burkholderiales bacterium]
MNPEPKPASANGWQPCWLASANVLNLALPGRAFYANQEPYGAAEYRRKTDWLGRQFERLGADVLAVQEVWDEAALRDAVAASGLRYAHVLAPGAEQGASGTPCLGLVTRWELEAWERHAAFDPCDAVQVPELGLHAGFERPLLQARLRGPKGQELTLLNCHLKSKRPKFLQDEAGEPLEDRDDPATVARATLRSLLMRAAECCAMRRIVSRLTQGRHTPLVLVGDFNDSPHAVTTQIVTATHSVAFDRAAADTALFHAWDVQTEAALRRDMAYSHVHQGWPELLDQIWVSEEFDARSRRSLGDVKRVEVFNDHLHEGRDRSRSDHGFLRALLRWRT